MTDSLRPLVVLIFVACTAPPIDDPTGRDASRPMMMLSDAGPPPPPGAPGCGLAAAAFCDTFDEAFPGGNAGALDEREWTAARVYGANFGQGAFNIVNSTTMEACGRTEGGLLPPNDFAICYGGGEPSMHMAMSHDDGGGFTVQSVRIRRPFDFEGRTGVIAFDVDGQARTPGGHGFWFNVFISEEPVPAPYQDGGALSLHTRAGIGIEFESSLVCTPSGEAGGGDDVVDGMLVNAFNGVSNIFIQEDYGTVRHLGGGDIEGGNEACFRTATGVMNHIEIHLSETSIEVFAADAGEPSTLRRVARVDGLELPFTRGYVNLQQAHYNAAKCTFTTLDCNDCDACPIMPSYRTYQWDNIAFDGPQFPTPRSYEIPAPNIPDRVGASTGWVLAGRWQQENGDREPHGMFDANDRRADPISIEGVDPTGVTRGWLTMNAWLAAGEADETIGYRFNGGPWRRFVPPFDAEDQGARAVAIPIEVADLRAGTNTLEMDSASGWVMVTNLDLTLDLH